MSVLYIENRYDLSLYLKCIVSNTRGCVMMYVQFHRSKVKVKNFGFSWQPMSYGKDFTTHFFTAGPTEMVPISIFPSWKQSKSYSPLLISHDVYCGFIYWVPISWIKENFHFRGYPILWFAEVCIQAYRTFVILWTFNFVVDLYPWNPRKLVPNKL